MPEHAPLSPTEPVHTGVRHERRDTNVYGLVMFGIGFVFAAVVIHVLLYALFVGMHRDRLRETSPAPLPPVARDRPTFPRDIDKIPEPRLQVGDRRDMAALLERDRVVLEGRPAWADANHTAVRIPIADALEILADPAEAAKFGLKISKEKDPR